MLFSLNNILKILNKWTNYRFKTNPVNEYIIIENNSLQLFLFLKLILFQKGGPLTATVHMVPLSCMKFTSIHCLLVSNIHNSFEKIHIVVVRWQVSGNRWQMTGDTKIQCLPNPGFFFFFLLHKDTYLTPAATNNKFFFFKALAVNSPRS